MDLLDSDAEEMKKEKEADKPSTGRKVSEAGLRRFSGLSKYSKLTEKYRAKTPDSPTASSNTEYPTVERGRGTIINGTQTDHKRSTINSNTPVANGPLKVHNALASKTDPSSQKLLFERKSNDTIHDRSTNGPQTDHRADKIILSQIAVTIPDSESDKANRSTNSPQSVHKQSTTDVSSTQASITANSELAPSNGPQTDHERSTIQFIDISNKSPQTVHKTLKDPPPFLTGASDTGLPHSITNKQSSVPPNESHYAQSPSVDIQSSLIQTHKEPIASKIIVPQTDHKRYTVGSTNSPQSEHNEDQHLQNSPQQNHKRSTTLITNSPRTDHNWSTPITFSSLFGIKRDIIFYIFQSCKLNGNHVGSDFISLDSLSVATKHPKGSMKNTLYRLREEGILLKGPRKNGRGGRASYMLSDSIYKEMVILEATGQWSTNSPQSVHDRSTILTTTPTTSPSSSSSSSLNMNNFKTTTEQETVHTELPTLPDEWLKLDISLGATIHFGHKQLLQVVEAQNTLVASERLSPKDVENSVNAIVFDVTQNMKKFHSPPLNVLMGLLRKGKTYVPPENYESPEELLMREMTERRLARQKKRHEVETQLFNAEFEEWLSELKPEEKKRLSNGMSEGAVTRAMLSNHFEANIWPQLKQEILSLGDKPKVTENGEGGGDASR